MGRSVGLLLLAFAAVALLTPVGADPESAADTVEDVAALESAQKEAENELDQVIRMAEESARAEGTAKDAEDEADTDDDSTFLEVQGNDAQLANAKKQYKQAKAHKAAVLAKIAAVKKLLAAARREHHKAADAAHLTAGRLKQARHLRDQLSSSLQRKSKVVASLHTKARDAENQLRRAEDAHRQQIAKLMAAEKHAVVARYHVKKSQRALKLAIDAAKKKGK